MAFAYAQKALKQFFFTNKTILCDKFDVNLAYPPTLEILIAICLGLIWLSHEGITYAHNCEFKDAPILQNITTKTPNGCSRACQTSPGNLWNSL